jgi:amino acid adenylation domain-containing protein
VNQTDSRTLTPREAEVLQLIAHGLTNAQVARQLDVTIHAVKFHLASIYRKLGVTNRTEAAGLFFQHLTPMREEEAIRSPNGRRSERERERRRAAIADPPVLDLSFAAPAGERAGGRGRTEACFGSEVTAALRAHASGNDLDLGTLLLAGFGALLHRYTGLPELVLRGAAGPLWIDATGDPSFDELVRRVQHELDAEPQAVTAGNGAGPARLQIAFAAGAIEPRCDLEVTVEERLEGLVAVAGFDLEVCDPAGVQQLLRRLPVLLEDAVEDPGRPVGALALLDAEERVRMLEEWNATACPFPACRADELIAARARANPAKVAVEFEDQELTYGELDARANGLAHLLQELGTGPDVLVGICVERSLDMLVGLIGIMRAGGAYVPIDPAFPADRRRFMLDDAAVQVVVTQESLLPELELSGTHTICLDRDAPRIAAAGSTAPECHATAGSLAYVIYTSGSTGKPKGVQIPHRALVNFLTTMSHEPGMGADDVLVAVTTLSFDIAGLELYLPLVAGARVVIAPQSVAADPRRLADLIEHTGATVVQATPTTWRMLVDSGWPGVSGLKALCGGEALPAVLAEQLLERGLELWNMYGPTETTIWSAVTRVQPGVPLTIGRPIANTTLYVLDDALQPVPVGLPGELHIGGDGLARGYLNRPELTTERFVPHPFGARPGARLYKTGDLVRYRDDGTIDFLGRRDHQVKVRGFRIELGEIETALARQPEVGAAVAITREDIEGDVRIVGYVVPADGRPPASADLRRALTEILPAYMVPSSVVVLAELPLTPNGKIDRKALPPPSSERPAESTVVGPRTPLEERLVRIWERELEISPIGVTDDFFDLGATSIVAARLFARLERELGTKLPLGAIFQAPTIESLALQLGRDSGDGAGRWTSLVPIQPNGSRPPIFCVHGGAGTILHLQPLARRLGSDQPFYGLQARGLYGGAPPLRTVEEMSEHYLDELRTVQPHGPYRLAGYCFGSIVAFEMAQRLTAEGEEVELLAGFNGPSSLWLRTFRSIGGQPSRRAQRIVTPRRPLSERVAGVIASPAKQRQWARHLLWRFRRRYVWPYRVRHSLRRGRPLPEHIRENYFLGIHAVAELAYEPSAYPGEMIVFQGAGLYDDPTLGWETLAASVETVAIPGEHAGNRTLMAEPYVGQVAERLQAHLAGPVAHATSPSAA